MQFYRLQELHETLAGRLSPCPVLFTKLRVARVRMLHWIPVAAASPATPLLIGRTPAAFSVKQTARAD